MNKKEKLMNLKKAMVMLGITTCAATALTGCSNKKQQEIEISYEDLDDNKKVFSKGEHTIVVPINDDILTNNVQYKYYEGYKPVGITCNSSGSSPETFYAGIVYINTEDVECKCITNKNENNSLEYTDFGSPLNKKTKTEDNDSEFKTFDAGEHIISIALTNDKQNNNMKNPYPFFEGYELVGIDYYLHNDWIKNIDGGCVCLLYVNTEPVECKMTYYDQKEKEYYYTDFGTPVEYIKQYTKNK